MSVTTGNTYGTKVSEIGSTALVAHVNQFRVSDQDPALLVYQARIIAIRADGVPVLAVPLPIPMVSADFVFVACATEAEIAALTIGQWTWPLTARDVRSLKSSAGAVDHVVLPGDGWVTVHSESRTSRGGTALSIQWTVTADVVLAGQARIVVSGGAYGAGQQVRSVVSFPALASAAAGSFGPAILPITADPGTTYTASIQVRAVGVGASVMVALASAPDANAAQIALVEYG